MISIFRNWKEGSILITDAGWGDSGKGKVVSALTPDIGAKIIGGHNAGHTIVTNKGEFGMGLVPSTIMNKKTVNIIGPEIVINPFFLINEIIKLKKAGIKFTSKNFIFDEKSHIVMPWHEIRDALSEEARGKGAIGSLHLGVGWTYSDKINRRGLRFIDLFAGDWKARIKNELETQKSVIDDMVHDVKIKTGKKSKVDTNINEKQLIKELGKVRKFLKPFSGNTIEAIWNGIDRRKKILFEDSHGAMLDVSHGSWPFTTGVNTSLGAIYRSFGGKAVKSNRKIITVIKSYQTRVGGGPMPTENFGKLGEYLQVHGGEIGTRSGRKRRCGPIDLPLLKYGLSVIGSDSNDEIALTKLDVLTGIKKIPVCVSYRFRGKVYKMPPKIDAEFLYLVKPVYRYLPGWKNDISSVRVFSALPPEARKYIEFIERELGRKITFIGVGKHKDAIIIR